MKPIDSYDTDARFLRVLLQGPPKSGKTVLACQFPNAYVIDLDLNLGGPLRFMRERNLPLPVGYDVVDKDDKGNAITPPFRYTRLVQLLEAAEKDPNISTIIIDSGTMLVDLIVNETLRLQNKSAMSKQEWGFFFNASKLFFSRLASARKHIIIPCHEKINKDPAGAVILPYEVAWPGQFGQIIGAFMTDVWRCECVEGPDPARPGFSRHAWQVKTLPNYQFKLGNSLGLPATFEFTWKTIEDKLKGGTK